MKTFRRIAGFCILALIAIGVIMIMKKENNGISSEGFIGRSSIEITDGKMTPEVLLALGRLSDPQISPDGNHILYGVSYTSVKDNRSVRNLYICNIDGSSPCLLTRSGKSISNARWSADGRNIAFLMGGQIYTAPVRQVKNGWKLGKCAKVSDVAAGIGEFKLSPDQSKIMYISYVKSAVKTPADCYEDLTKATAYT